MMHSATMTIDRRYLWSFMAWLLAAACALSLAHSAKTLVLRVPLNVPTSQSLEHNYSHTGSQIN